MYRLYVSPNTYAMAAHAILEEIGADYEPYWVEIFTEKPDPAFLAASPHARVPALADEHGSLCESGAVALYLAERHPEAGLMIPVGDPRRGAFLQWLSYLSSTLQPDVILQFHPEFYFTEAADQERLTAASHKRLDGVLKTLDNALDPGPYFFGEQLTILDFCFALQAVWDEIFPGSIDDYPNIKRLVETMSARPSVRRVLGEHQVRS